MKDTKSVALRLYEHIEARGPSTSQVLQAAPELTGVPIGTIRCALARLVECGILHVSRGYRKTWQVALPFDSEVVYSKYNKKYHETRSKFAEAETHEERAVRCIEDLTALYTIAELEHALRVVREKRGNL